MTPNWNIGPQAQGRLAKMHKAGWDDQTIRHETDSSDCWVVELWNTLGLGCLFMGRGSTIGLAVAEAYGEWKREVQDE